MTWDEAVTKAREDYDRVLGTVIEADWLYGYKVGGDDVIDTYCNPPIKVRVLPVSSESELQHYVDGWLDPFWNVELINPEELPHLRSCWVFGTSYEFQEAGQ